MEELSLNPPPTYDQLVAALAKEKRAHRKTRNELEQLEIDFGHLDDDKRSFEAEVKVLDDENEELKEKIAMYEDCWGIVETATAGEGTNKQEDSMEIDKVEEGDEGLVVCKNWAKQGRCRRGLEGETCKHGYHPSKKGYKPGEMAEAEEEKTLV